MPDKTARFVVVTTEHRGVFGGVLNGDQDSDATTLTLTDAQMCVYWSADMNGVLGLASSGPSRSCRVSPSVPKITLQGVTSVVDATEDAEKAWRARPWS